MKPRSQTIVRSKPQSCRGPVTWMRLGLRRRCWSNATTRSRRRIRMRRTVSREGVNAWTRSARKRSCPAPRTGCSTCRRTSFSSRCSGVRFQARRRRCEQGGGAPRPWRANHRRRRRRSEPYQRRTRLGRPCRRSSMATASRSRLNGSPIESAKDRRHLAERTRSVSSGRRQPSATIAIDDSSIRVADGDAYRRARARYRRPTGRRSDAETFPPSGRSERHRRPRT